MKQIVVQAACGMSHTWPRLLSSPILTLQVDVQFVRLMKRFIPLAELKTHHQAHKASGGPLRNMLLFTRQRLSIQPLTPGKSRHF